MKKIILLMVIILSCYGCKKVDDENSKSMTGTYSGEKTVYYLYTNYKSADTITINFESNSYSYSGSSALDFGRGNYLMKNNSIILNDDEARIDLYSWEWILTGTHELRIIGDSLFLNQNRSSVQVSYRLKKIKEQ
jgi:hypothetical protein